MRTFKAWLCVCSVALLFAHCTKSNDNEKQTEDAANEVQDSQDSVESLESNHALPTRPNIVVVLIDTLRPDYLDFMGGVQGAAPFLTSLAKKSVVFEHARSTSSWTAPSVASLFTGLYPPQHTVKQGFRAHRVMVSEMADEGDATLTLNKMPTDLATLPEILKSAGYRTFGVAANINIGDEIGFSRGFDRFEKHTKATASEIYQKVLSWQESIVGNRPFFLYLHVNDAHVPYHRRAPYFTPAKDRKADAMARYRSEITYLDSYLEKIHDLSGLTQNTVWVFLSDHGEEFWEHGSTEHGPTLYGELNNILFMIHAPRLTDNGRRVTENVSLVDVTPTLSALAKAPLKQRREGLSLVPVLQSGPSLSKTQTQKRLHERCLFAHRVYSSVRNIAVWSTICGRFKLIDWWGERRKLFDLGADKGEFYDIRSKKPKTTQELSGRLSSFKDRMKKGAVTTEKDEIALDEALLERLRKLGYVE